MPEMSDKVYELLLERILPDLNRISLSDADHHSDQTIRSQELSRNFEEFRATMQVLMGEIRAEIALCRQQVEDAMVTLRESFAEEETETPQKKKRKIVH